LQRVGHVAAAVDGEFEGVGAVEYGWG
jgi:hypothetical protein